MKRISRSKAKGGIRAALSIATGRPSRSSSEPKRDATAAQAFFEKALGAPHTVSPRLINVAKNAAYPKAVDRLKTNQQLPQECELRQVKYLNNLIEQDHCFIKRRTRPGLGFFSFDTARRTLAGYETMHMIRKGQMKGAEKGDSLAQVELINRVFEIAAQFFQFSNSIRLFSKPVAFFLNNLHRIRLFDCRNAAPCQGVLRQNQNFNIFRLIY